jgi:hypothetical protein
MYATKEDELNAYLDKVADAIVKTKKHTPTSGISIGNRPGAPGWSGVELPTHADGTADDSLPEAFRAIVARVPSPLLSARACLPAGDEIEEADDA